MYCVDFKRAKVTTACRVSEHSKEIVSSICNIRRSYFSVQKSGEFEAIIQILETQFCAVLRKAVLTAISTASDCIHQTLPKKLK